MTRFILIAASFMLAAGQAQAAYKARWLVEPGPLFNAPPVVTSDSTGTKVRSDIKAADIEKSLAAPGGVAVLKTGDTDKVYVADVATLREVDSQTGAIRNVLPLMATDFYPTTVNATRNGQLLVGSWISGRVRLIDAASGAVVREEANLSEPYDAVMLPDGAWLVAEAGAKQLTAIAADGTRTVWAKDFERPVGLALTGQSLYVVDRAAGTLSVIDVQTLSRRVIAKDLEAPEGVLPMTDGTIAVFSTDAREVSSYDVATGQKRRVANNFAVGDQAETFFVPTLGKPADPKIYNGLALGTDGTIYVGSDIQTTLYALKTGEGPESFLAMIRGLTSKLFR